MQPYEKNGQATRPPNSSTPRDRLARYIRAGNDPYRFQCGDVMVRMEFLDQDRSLQDCLEAFFIAQKEQIS